MVARPPLLARFLGLPTVFNKVDFAYIQPGFNDWSSKQGEYVVSVFVNIFTVSNSFWEAHLAKGPVHLSVQLLFYRVVYFDRAPSKTFVRPPGPLRDIVT